MIIMKNSELANRSPSVAIPLQEWQDTIRAIARNEPEDLRAQITAPDPPILATGLGDPNLPHEEYVAHHNNLRHAEDAQKVKRNLNRGVDELSFRGRVRAVVVGAVAGYLVLGSALGEAQQWMDHEVRNSPTIEKVLTDFGLDGPSPQTREDLWRLGAPAGSLGGFFLGKRRRYTIAHKRASEIDQHETFYSPYHS